MLYKSDLHIHSCLSPCASLDMSPSAVALNAKRRGLDIIALTDHNSGLNLPAFGEACRRHDVMAVFGMEVNTREEVHVLTLFETADTALEFGNFLRRYFPAVKNDPDKFGDQIWVDADEVIQGVEDRFLLSAVDLSIDDIFKETLIRGGLFIPAHIDRPSFSIFSQLGFLPDMAYSALEAVSHPCKYDTGLWHVIADSDAHEIDDIGKRFTLYDMADRTFASLKSALADGRLTCGEGPPRQEKG